MITEPQQLNLKAIYLKEKKKATDLFRKGDEAITGQLRDKFATMRM